MRISAIIQPCLGALIALLSVFSQSVGMWRYQKLFKPGPAKVMVFISVLPIILVTPLVKATVLLAALFGQLMTFTNGSSYDTKVENLIVMDQNRSSLLYYFQIVDCIP